MWSPVIEQPPAVVEHFPGLSPVLGLTFLICEIGVASRFLICDSGSLFSSQASRVFIQKNHDIYNGTLQMKTPSKTKHSTDVGCY